MQNLDIFSALRRCWRSVPSRRPMANLCCASSAPSRLPPASSGRHRPVTARKSANRLTTFPLSLASNSERKTLSSTPSRVLWNRVGHRVTGAFLLTFSHSKSGARGVSASAPYRLAQWVSTKNPTGVLAKLVLSSLCRTSAPEIRALSWSSSPKLIGPVTGRRIRFCSSQSRSAIPASATSSQPERSRTSIAAPKRPSLPKAGFEPETVRCRPETYVFLSCFTPHFRKNIYIYGNIYIWKYIYMEIWWNPPKFV